MCPAYSHDAFVSRVKRDYKHSCCNVVIVPFKLFGQSSRDVDAKLPHVHNVIRITSKFQLSGATKHALEVLIKPILSSIFEESD